MFENNASDTRSPMTETPCWWSKDISPALHTALAFINAARHCREPLDRCQRLFGALDTSWNAFARLHSPASDRWTSEARFRTSDLQRCARLFQHGCKPECQTAFLKSAAVRELALLSPPVLDQSVWPDFGGRGGNFSAPDREGQAAKHAKLREAFERHHASRHDDGPREVLLKSVAGVVSLVRCNVMHGENPPEGPARGQVERDTKVLRIVGDVVEEFFEHLCALPSRRFAVYGTLAPGEVNSHLLECIKGDWSPADVRGRFGRRYGYPVYTWDPDQPARTVQVFTSATLPEHWPRLDDFEGDHYRRHWVPVETAGEAAICNIYEAAEPV